MATLQVAPWAEGPRAAELHPGAELVDLQGARNTNSESTLDPVLLREKPHTSATARENLRDAPVIGR